MKLQRKRAWLWLLLVDSAFIGACAVFISGVFGVAVLQLPFHTDYRHYLVTVIALMVGATSGCLWFICPR